MDLALGLHGVTDTHQLPIHRVVCAIKVEVRVELSQLMYVRGKYEQVP